MQKQSLVSWDINKQNDALLFFAQRLDELLFQYTLDSYKPPCLNSVYLAREALSVINEVENGVLDNAAIIPVLEELSWSIERDYIAKDILGDEANNYIIDLDNNKLSKVKYRIELLSNKLSPVAYVRKCMDYIYELVDKNDKVKISKIASDMVSVLINFGLSKRYLKECADEVFFSSKVGLIRDKSILPSFFSKIYPSSHEYKLCFVVSSLFDKLSEVTSRFGAKVFKTLDDIDEDLKGIKYRINSDREVFVVFDSIRAYDHFSACRAGEIRIEKMANLYSLFHHKRVIEWRSGVGVFNSDDSALKLITLHENPIKNGMDLPPTKAAKTLTKVVNGMEFSSQESFFKFDSVVDLHGLAAKSDSYASQLLNIWISVETLNPPDSTVSKIKNIIKKMMPFLMLGYFRRLIRQLRADIYRWDAVSFKKILKSIDPVENDNSLYKMARFVVLDKYDGLRKEMYGRMVDFPNLRTRIFSLSKSLKSSAEFQKFLDSHQKKLEWQIRRLYRTRNLIVHSGSAPSYLPSLVENGHGYLDQVLNAVMNLTAYEKDCDTLEQAYEHVSMLYDTYRKKIRSIKSLDENNCSYLIYDGLRV